MAKKKHLTIEEAAEAGQTMEAMSWLLLNKPLPSPPVTHGGTMSKTKTHTWNELVHGTDETEAAEPTPALDVAQVDAALARDNARIMEGKAGAAPRTLWQKIACAMGLVGYVQKRGKNQFHKYSYATAADVAEKAREAFLEVGLLFLPTVKAVETREKATSKGGITYITRVTMTYRVMNTTPEESFYEFEMVASTSSRWWVKARTRATRACSRPSPARTSMRSCNCCACRPGTIPKPT